VLDLFILSCEASGDLLGASLVSKLLEQNPKLKIGAIAGPRMRQLPIEEFFRMEDLQVMGFVDVFFALPKIITKFFAIRKKILELKPKAVLFIDYPGFNLRMARSLRKKGFEGLLIHYVCPSVWAWGKKRIPLMEKNLDLLLTFFPFEPPLFVSPRLQVEHVGHPLARAIVPSKELRSPTLALFPGSRTSEIEKNLPLQAQVAKEILAQDPKAIIAVSISHPEKESLIRALTRDLLCIYVPQEKTYSLMKTAKVALATSGTVTLELALHNTPTVVQYYVRPFDLFLAQRIFRINLPFYCIVNILAGKEIFPELFGPNLTFNNLLNRTQNLWFSSQNETGCEEVQKILTNLDASTQAAYWVLKRMSLSVENG